MKVLRLMGREYCSLCEEMRKSLSILTEQKGFILQWVDIDDDDALEEKYHTLVPALVGEKEELICFYHLDMAALDAYLGKIR